MSWFSRFRNALRPARLDAELSEEIRDHLERRAEALQENGLDEAEARRRAALRFGNPMLLREQSRDLRLWAALESTLQDLRYGCRGILRSPLFAATAVLSLGLAIGANTAIYSIIDAAMLRPLPVPEPDRLFTLGAPVLEQPGIAPLGETDRFSFPLYSDFQSAAGHAARIAAFGAVTSVEAQQGTDETAPFEKVNEALVSGDSFEILKVSPTLGRLFSSEDDQGIDGHLLAVLSYEYWQQRMGGDPAVAGRMIRLAGRPTPFRVIGVAQKGFFGVDPGKFVDVWVPVKSFDPDAFTNPASRWLRIMGRLAPGITTAQLEARLQPAFHRSQEDFARQDASLPPSLQKQLREMNLRVKPGAAGMGGFRNTFGRALWILFAVAIGILLIASANLASLLTARSAARSAEMAVRVSLGAGRIRLVRQLATESFLLSTLAAICGWILACWAAPLFTQALSRPNDPVRLVLTPDARVLLFCAATCALSGLFFGLLPAWHATSAKSPISALRHSSGQAGKLRLGRFLLGVQVAFAFCLVTVGFGFVLSLHNLLSVDPGFDANSVSILNINNDSRKLQMALMQDLPRRLSTNAGITGVAIGWGAIFEGGKRAEPVLVAGQLPNGRDEIYYRVSPGFFAALKIPLTGGRDLEVRDNDGQQPVPTVVNRAFARRYFQSDNILGREFQRVDGTRHVIIGLVADSYYGDLRGGLQPIAYFPLKPGAHFALYVRSHVDPLSLVRLVEREGRAIAPGVRVTEITTLDAMVGSTLFRERMLAGLGGIFGGLALALAAIGLFGLLSYSVSRRTREIGIRGALGAKPVEIVALVWKDLLGLTAAGLLCGTAGSLLLMRLLKTQLFGVQPVDPFVLGLSAAAFLIAAIAAGGLPAIRAASVDPAITLRED